MNTFRFDATVEQPRTVTPDVRDSFEAAIQASGATDLRIGEDAEGRTTVSFLLDAEGVREALSTGSDITLSAPAEHHAVRWLSAGATWWPEAAH